MSKPFTRFSSVAFAFASLFIPMLAGCGNSGSEVAKIVEERDSLRNAVKQQNVRLSMLDTLISVVNSGMDSITSQEQGLFTAGVHEGPDKRRDILNNLDRLQQLVTKQQQRIQGLEQQLAASNANNSANADMSGLVANLKRQLLEKEQQIAELRTELSKKNSDINALMAQVGTQSRTISDLTRKNAAQTEALRQQDAMLNNCYMAIGTKKALQQKGIIKKGKVVAQSSFDRSKFSKVDIRKFTEIQFSGKKPRILTPMPESSYEILTDGYNNYVIHIKNPNAFWKVSNILVIQTD